ncbi:hypothetical protein [Pseudomonas sp.]|uniref:hypothetical protein n=1 Tax=Pseudomonas sp. TaxID=306 RepID=UPI0027305AEA|nr:hypothetical protein [Pseudomonas sp.]MDP2243686.1 hypothetical protein [Pseudomonas sp.]
MRDIADAWLAVAHFLARYGVGRVGMLLGMGYMMSGRYWRAAQCAADAFAGGFTAAAPVMLKALGWYG